MPKQKYTKKLIDNQDGSNKVGNTIRKVNFVLLGVAVVVCGIHLIRFGSSKLKKAAETGVAPVQRLAQVTAAITTLETPASTAEDGDTYTLIVVRCTKNVTWLEQVPSNWRIVVYDKCRTNTAQDFPLPNMMRYEAENLGQEECTTYMKYILDFYDNLTDVNVFGHDDALSSWSVHKGDMSHTPFESFAPLTTAIQQFLTPQQPFLPLGSREIAETFGADPYHGEAMTALWPYFGNDTTTPRKITFRPGAHFAVRKSQILMRSKEAYQPLCSKLAQKRDIRITCCAMERLWHIFFGQPPVLPASAILTDLLNMTKCTFCKTLAHVNRRPMIN